MAEADGTVEVDADIVRQTELAICIYDGSKTVWLPKSQLIDPAPDEIGEYRDGDSLIITIPEWLAIEKGLV